MRLAHGCGRLHAVHAGQAVVHQHDVRLEALDRGNDLAAVADRRDDLEVRTHAEQQLECLAEDLVVLDEEDPDRPPHGGADSTRPREAGGNAAGRRPGRRPRRPDAPRRSGRAGRRAAPCPRRRAASAARAGSRSSRSTTAYVTSSKSSPPATGCPPASPSHSPLRIATPFICTSREAIVTSPVATDADRLAHLGRVLGCAPRAVERDHRSEAGRGSSRVHDLDDAVGVRGGMLGGEHDVRVVREDDPPPPRRATARRAAGRPSTDSSSGRPRRSRSGRRFGEALEEQPVPFAGDDRDDAATAPRGASGTAASRRSSRCCVCSCMFAISIRSIVPDARADRERRAGIVRVHVHLDRAFRRRRRAASRRAARARTRAPRGRARRPRSGTPCST